MITVIGLGTQKGDVSLRAFKRMQEADEVILRTGTLPSAEGIREAGIPFTTLDFLYEKSRNFETLTKNILREVRARARNKKVCYCVDGGATEDRAAQLLIARGAEVMEGVSKAAAAAARLGLGCSYESVSAYEVSEKKLALPLIVYDVCDRSLASDVKLLLCDKFGDEAPAAYCCDEKIKRMPLYEIDRQKTYNEHTLICVFDAPLLERKRFDLEDLMTILRRLRAPDGCPWDKVQTHESIRINAIEEAYELVDAIDCNSPEKMCEEAGDVIMQAAFHTEIEEEKGNFNLTDVLSGLCEKLITRHTHVFGQDRAKDADAALSVWDKNKMKEKGQATYSDAVSDVPRCFPALLRAQKIAKRIAKGGWAIGSFDEIVAVLEGEIEELREAVASGSKADISEEVGDVLLTAVELGRTVGADCEQALLDTVKKLSARFTEYERLVLADGKEMLSLTEEEKDAYYKRAKENVDKA